MQLESFVSRYPGRRNNVGICIINIAQWCQSYIHWMPPRKFLHDFFNNVDQLDPLSNNCIFAIPWRVEPQLKWLGQAKSYTRKPASHSDARKTSSKSKLNGLEESSHNCHNAAPETKPATPQTRAQTRTLTRAFFFMWAKKSALRLFSHSNFAAPFLEIYTQEFSKDSLYVM